MGLVVVVVMVMVLVVIILELDILGKYIKVVIINFIYYREYSNTSIECSKQHTVIKLVLLICQNHSFEQN